MQGNNAEAFSRKFRYPRTNYVLYPRTPLSLKLRLRYSRYFHSSPLGRYICKIKISLIEPPYEVVKLFMYIS